MASDERLRFSDRLESWLSDGDDHSVGALAAAFEEQSFAVLFVVLLAFPALPIPTGGVSHVLEIAAMLLALELVAGRRQVWLPGWLAKRQLTTLARPKVSASLLKRVRWVEGKSRPRLGSRLEHRAFGVVFGLIVLGLSITAFVAPPFSGLDTLPSLGVVVLSLGVLLRDALVALIGSVLGAVGVGLVVALGRAVLSFF